MKIKTIMDTMPGACIYLTPAIIFEKWLEQRKKVFSVDIRFLRFFIQFIFKQAEASDAGEGGKV